MNKELIGPKLDSFDNKDLENIFLEQKNKVDSNVFDDFLPNPNSVPALNINQRKIIKKKDDCLSISPKTKKNQNAKTSGLTKEYSKNKRAAITKLRLNPLYFLGKSKRLALKIRKMFYYKNFNNLTNSQKCMLNDKTDFSCFHPKKNPFKVMIFYLKFACFKNYFFQETYPYKCYK